MEGAPRHLLTGSAVFVLCMTGLVLVRLLPLQAGVTGWPGPDLGLCLTLAWVLRRPDNLAALVIVAVYLAEDVLLLRPFGLWTLAVLLATEAARRREAGWREQPFMVEWLRVSILIGAMMLGYRTVHLLVLLPVPALGQSILQYLATVIAYPVVVFVARWLIGLRRISPVEADMMRYAR